LRDNLDAKTYLDRRAAEQLVRGFWLGIDTGGNTLRPWYAWRPIAAFEIKDE
jgi:hypothetical protein